MRMLKLHIQCSVYVSIIEMCTSTIPQFKPYWLKPYPKISNDYNSLHIHYKQVVHNMYIDDGRLVTEL